LERLTFAIAAVNVGRNVVWTYAAGGTAVVLWGLRAAIHRPIVDSVRRSTTLTLGERILGTSATRNRDASSQVESAIYQGRHAAEQLVTSTIPSLLADP